MQRWLERPDYLAIFNDVGSIQLDVGNFKGWGSDEFIYDLDGLLAFLLNPHWYLHALYVLALLTTSCLGYPSYTTGSRSKRPRK